MAQRPTSTWETTTNTGPVHQPTALRTDAAPLRSLRLCDSRVPRLAKEADEAAHEQVEPVRVEHEGQRAGEEQQTKVEGVVRGVRGRRGRPSSLPRRSKSWCA